MLQRRCIGPARDEFRVTRALIVGERIGAGVADTARVRRLVRDSTRQRCGGGARRINKVVTRQLS